MSRQDLETGADDRAMALAEFVRGHRLEVLGPGCGSWRRTQAPAGDAGREIDYWMVRGAWHGAKVTAEKSLQARSDGPRGVALAVSTASHPADATRMATQRFDRRRVAPQCEPSVGTPTDHGRLPARIGRGVAHPCFLL